jgi:signal transduction histidine kinase
VIIEDDAAIRSALGDLLVDEGYEVMSFENARRALDQLVNTSSPPHAIVLDLCLPGMDGWEFRVHQRANPALSGISVLAISEDASAKAAAIHADAYLRKPFAPADLLAQLERVLLERENQQIRTRLDQSQRLIAIGIVAAGVAQKIKDPLTLVMGNLRLAGDVLVQMGSGLASAGPSDVTGVCADHRGFETGLRQLEELIGDACTGVERISTVVEELALRVRPAEGNLEPVSLSAVVDSAIRMAAHHIHRCARLVREYSDSPSVVGDHAGLTQVFLNLLVNACQAVPAGGASRHEIRVRICAGDADAVVEIVDTGSGIDLAVQPKIFEPFFSTKPASEGAGLGLSICRHLVALHGGKIEFESEPGRGSRFRVLLPQAHPAHE